MKGGMCVGWVGVGVGDFTAMLLLFFGGQLFQGVKDFLSHKIIQNWNLLNGYKRNV